MPVAFAAGGAAALATAAAGNAAGARNFKLAAYGREDPGFRPAGFRKPLRQSACPSPSVASSNPTGGAFVLWCDL